MRSEPERGREGVTTGEAGEDAMILEAREVSRRYPVRRSMGRSGTSVVAVEKASLGLRPGEAVGLVGESGSGKSTLGRLLLGLEDPDDGEVLFEGRELSKQASEDRLRFRRAVQVVFQDPFASLNPRITVGGALREILGVHELARGEAAERRVAELLEQVGIDPGSERRYPHEFSGGQRQRIGIARALCLGPRVIIADEPVSALDVSVQAKVLQLMVELRRALGLTYLFISHDLAVVRQVCDRVLVMQEGKIIERGPSTELFSRPRDPYTQRLLRAVPRLPRVGGKPAP
jgi:ABC-type glutathione transport system ATPase component